MTNSCFLGVAAAAATFLALSPASFAQASAETSPTQGMFQRVPVVFIQNNGQVDSAARFLSYNGDLTTFFTNNSFVLQLTPREAVENAAELAERSESLKNCNLRIAFEGALESSTVRGNSPLVTKVNYLFGQDSKQWHTDVPTFAGLKYENLYQGVGIDLQRHESADGRLHIEYNLELAPGADLSQVVLKVEGAKGLSLEQDGTLVVDTAAGPLRQELPAAWQVAADGQRRDVSARFRLIDAERFGFEADGVDASQALVVDPVLVYATYVGGMNCEMAFGVATDTSADAFVTGLSQSSDFPTTLGAFDTTWNNDDILLLKMDATGQNLLFSTFIGGSGIESGQAIQLGSSGDIFISGKTTSADFPVTAGAFDTTHGGGEDAYVVRVNPAGNGLVYGTYLGGASEDGSYGLDVVGDQAIATGTTTSSDYPTTLGAHQTALNGSRDAFVTRLSADGGSALYSTYFGGSATDYGYALAANAAGEAFITGKTRSADMQVTAGAVDTSHSNGDAFMARFDAGGQLTASTFFGGNDLEEGLAIEVGFNGVVYIGGFTESPDLVTTPGVIGPALTAVKDGFITAMTPDATALVFSTYLGGNATDQVEGLAIDPVGTVFAVGFTASTNFPVSQTGFQLSNGGSEDAFYVTLNPTGVNLDFGTYLGGAASDHGFAVALDQLNYAAIMAGHARDGFPVTSPVYQGNFAGGSGDVIVVRIDPRSCPNTAVSQALGTGCGASMTSNPPIQGTLLNVVVNSIYPNSAGLIYFSQPGGVPFQFEGCDIFLDLGTFAPLATIFTNGQGTGTLTLPVFNDPARCGQSVVFQGIVLGLSGPAFYGATTNGLLLSLGS